MDTKTVGAQHGAAVRRVVGMQQTKPSRLARTSRSTPAAARATSLASRRGSCISWRLLLSGGVGCALSSF
jgi:hypothetical protein